MKLERLTACLLAGAMAVSVALTGCGTTINADAVGATLNEKEISLGFMNFMARYMQTSYDDYYASYYSNYGMEYSIDAWHYESDGATMEDSVKDSVVENIKLMYLLEEHMADYGVEITEDELAAMEEAAKQFMSDNSKKAIKQLGATEEYVKEMLRLYTIQQKMADAIYEETEITVTEADAAQRTFSYISVATSTTDSDGNTVEYTEDEIAALESELNTFVASAKEDFDTAAEEAEYTVSTYSYGVDEDSMDEAVITAADALTEGGVSDLITTEDNYYVIRLDSEYDEAATATKLEEMIEEQKSEHYTEVTDGYVEEAAFELNEKEWKKVKFNRLFSVAAEEEETEE